MYNRPKKIGVNAMTQLKLEKLQSILEKHKNDTVYNYTVPDLWNCFDYPEDKLIKTPTNELMVNPYEFYSYLIEHVFLPHKKPDIDPADAISKHTARHTGGDWVKQSVMYSAFIRASSAWDHDRSGTLEDENIYHLKETGTFIKTLALLPLLKKMGVTVLYLLPISKYSIAHKKGDLGSPYAVSNFTALDENLKDPMTKDAMTINEEFKALIEACHLLDIRVVIDIIPRTNAIESDLIRNHPDWFYWIDADAEYKVPFVEGIEPITAPTKDRLEIVFKSPDVKRHLNQFAFDPKTQDKTKYARIKKSKDILGAIKKHYNIKVAPAFSDWINDTQPPWTDVTFFRMYKDHPNVSKPYIGKDQPPYVLYDSIKSNKYPGNEPNDALWDTLTNIIPTYQSQFGIDGARIDMGHALPHDLLKKIMEKAKANDPDFAFIAEELAPKEAKHAKAQNYNMIIGNGFWAAPRIYEEKAYDYYYNSVNHPLPVFACTETHDTKRIASRHGGQTLAKTTTILNMFMPNGIPFINSAQEVYEVQPMNLGLDCTEEDLYHLDETDPYYKKLALFDRYQFHYTNPTRWEIPDILDAIKPIRKKYLAQISRVKNYVPLHTDNKQFIGYAYYKKAKHNHNNVLLILANLSPDHEAKLALGIEDVRQQSNNQEMHGKLLFSTHEGPRAFTQFYNKNTLDIHLGKGEVKIVEL